MVVPLVVAALPLLGTRGFEEKEEESRNRSSLTLERLLSANMPAGGSTEHALQDNALPYGFLIRGRKTLKEIERVTGVEVKQILEAMKLPADTPRDLRISQLKNEYGFEMDRLRDSVKNLMESISPGTEISNSVVSSF